MLLLNGYVNSLSRRRRCRHRRRCRSGLFRSQLNNQQIVAASLHVHIPLHCPIYCAARVQVCTCAFSAFAAEFAILCRRTAASRTLDLLRVCVRAIDKADSGTTTYARVRIPYERTLPKPIGWRRCGGGAQRMSSNTLIIPLSGALSAAPCAAMRELRAVHSGEYYYCLRNIDDATLLT